MKLNLKNRRLIYGVGINDADYITQPNKGVRCPIFDKWHSMLRRCYSENSLIRNPFYTNVFVCDEWLTFSNFKTWMEVQDWDGKVLDKDLIGDSRIYSPLTCVFISSHLNTFIAEKLTTAYPGVSLKFKDGRKNKFIAQAMVLGKKKHLGCFSSQLSAHRAWQQAKLKESQRLLSIETNQAVITALLVIQQNILRDIKLGEITRRLK